MEGHAKTCVERYCELANKQSSNCTRSPRHVLTTISSKKKKKWKRWENCPKSARTSSFLKCLYLARIGRPDILWPVNKLAPEVTKWTRACDRRVARLISYIHNTSDYMQHCHVGNTAQHCRFGLFRDSDFAGILKTQNRLRGAFCVSS